MTMALPNITIIGARLVESPELRFTPSGAAVTNFRIACNDRIKDGDQWKDGDPVFLSCTVWRDQAENAAEKLDKGSLVNVYGRLKQRKYMNRESVEVTVTEVDVEEVSLSLKWKDKGDRQQARSTPQQATRAPQSDPWAKGGQSAAVDPWGQARTEEPPF